MPGLLTLYVLCPGAARAAEPGGHGTPHDDHGARQNYIQRPERTCIFEFAQNIYRVTKQLVQNLLLTLITSCVLV